MGTQKLWTILHHLQTNGQCERFNFTLIGMLGTLSPEWKSDWKGSIGVLAHAYSYTRNSTMGFSPYFLMYGRQPHLPIDVTLGLTPNSVATPTSTKYVWKLRECARWAPKVDQFQQKEAWHHKQNYDKHRRAAAWKEGYTVLICVTIFKGWHKIQNWWENREYVVEWWPYPNLPVYMVCPRDGEGYSQTLHRNYLLPISNNLEQVGDENSVAGVEPIDKPTPVPPVDSGLPANRLTKRWPENLPNLPPQQHKPFDLEPTVSAASGMMSDGSQAGQNQPAPLRQSACTMRNQLPWRYQNFTLQQNNTTHGAFDVWDGLHTCLHLMVGLYNTSWKSTVWKYST